MHDLAGLLITLEKPTKEMIREAASHGYASYGLGDVRCSTTLILGNRDVRGRDGMPRDENGGLLRVCR